MKVVEKGLGWSIKLKCTGEGNGGGGCSSILQVEKNDIQYVTYMSWGEKEYCYTFRCPVCNVETDIREINIPGSVRELCIRRSL